MSFLWITCSKELLKGRTQNSHNVEIQWESINGALPLGYGESIYIENTKMRLLSWEGLTQKLDSSGELFVFTGE
jgi:hypothetical protein